MNEIDRKVETVLRGLREAQPDDSLERRIAEALRAQQPHLSVSWFGNWARILRVAGGTVVCLAIVAILFRPSRKPQTQEVVRRTASAPHVIAKQPTLTFPVPVRKHGQATTLAPSPTSRATPHDTDNARLEASFPAPPMPLTEQEKLLIRLAHRDDPMQLAQLAPGPRDARYQAEKDQVSEFFTPPVSPAQPDTTLMESGGGTQ